MSSDDILRKQNNHIPDARKMVTSWHKSVYVFVSSLDHILSAR